MPQFVLPLTDASITLANSGGKAANLHKLIAGGFPTPPGFVITTEAYRAFVQANALGPEIARHTAQTDSANPDSFESASRALRELFERGQMPPEIAEAIRSVVSSQPSAVRSSATAEDLPDASFAGQQDTYLHIQGAQAVQDAVQKCWGSLWTARAMAYRRKNNIGPEGVALAVVVQPMVPARVAGVLFTVNPVTGQRDEIVINATWGLGEALVSGQVNPDTVIVDKASGAIKAMTIGDKAVMTAPAENGTAEVEVSAAQRNAATLTPAHAAELARLARDIENHFDAPQDIEWAIADEKIFILQSRPITTVGGAPGDDAWPPLITDAPQPYDLWSQADVGERWPDPVTPLTWSLWCGMMNENFWDGMKELPSAMPREAQWAKRAYGRVYMNEGALMHVYTHELGMPASRVAAGLGAQGQQKNDGWNWGLVVRRAPVLLKMMGTMMKHVKVYEDSFPQIDAWVDAFMRRDLSAVSDADLWAENRTWRQRGMEHMVYHVSVTGMSMSNFPTLEKIMQDWLGDKALAHTLITGLTGIIQAEIVPSLQALAQTLRDAGLAEVLLNNAPAAALAQLRAAPSAAPFLAQFDSFLQRHGHRCATEAEMMHPRWIEAPELVIENIAGYLKSDGAAKIAANEQRQRQQRTEVEARVRRKLDPFRRAYFNYLLSQTQHQVRMRDNGQGYLVKLLLPWRHIFGVLAQRWAERGWIEAAEDFFFLVTEEIETVLKAGDPTPAQLDLRAIVRERRKAYAYWFTVSAPEVLDAHGQPVQNITAADSTAEVLSGVAASAGKITGVARLIANPREMGRLQPGEILVTRATDPGWTPIFSVASAVVLEVGGLLSHGAIVAREYGLPAVVNVAEAMRRIEDGQTITVDGGTGKVYLKVEK